MPFLQLIRVFALQSPLVGVEGFVTGARRGWTARLGGRDVELEAHATIRNLLDRRNVWGFSTLGAEQAPRSLMLRPLSVLTAGLDFRY